MNSRFIKPFEEITKLYGLPKYSEIDPTPILAITFPIIFGLMFGDLGHGLVLLAGGLTVGLLIKSNQSIKNVCFIMAACGIASMVAGLLFGEFFGLPLPWGPLWFSPFEGGVITFLFFALFIGVIQIVSGLVIEGINFAVQHKMADALLTSLPKILFYLGGVYIIATYQLDVGAWLNGAILLAIVPFVILIVGKPAYLAIAKPPIHASAEHAEMDTVSGRLFEGGDFFTRLLSNTISYSRILALLMAHWALMLAVYSIAAIINPPDAPTTLGFIIAGVVIVFGNIFVLALEGLIVFIHTLRLHFYEWFSKFYAGTGIEFHPFKQTFTHTDLTLKKKPKEKQDGQPKAEADSESPPP
jgi:V/A-type H+-transporting ATPase subunit I